MSWFIVNVISAFLLPPLSLLIPLVGCAIIFKRYPKLARGLLIASLSVLWLLATPYCAEGLLHCLESRTTALSLPLTEADAIVILGGGSYVHAPDYEQQDTVSEQTLVRLRYGAKLYHQTQRPILVTGGRPLGNNSSEAEQMRKVLEQEFQVPVRWIEDSSNNTLENARYSFQRLQKEHIKKIYLVTHAKHSIRAADSFRHAGFEVIQAPTAFTTRYQTDLLSFLPSASALRDSRDFIHEIIGLLWYGQIKK
ncbi:MAG: YdcF family protein [Methylococcaceae bacterium]